MTTPADVRATLDVLRDVQEASDGLDIEGAVALREAVDEVLKETRATLGLIDTQLVSVLESPREINGVRYEVRKSDGAWRPDHMKVDAAVKARSVVDTDTGEMLSAPHAVDRAIAWMHKLYRAKSTMPKVGGLGDLGLKKWDVAEQEPGKPVLKTTPIVEAPE